MTIVIIAQGTAGALTTWLIPSATVNENALEMVSGFILIVLLFGNLAIVSIDQTLNKTRLRKRLNDLQKATNTRLEKTVNLRTQQLKASLQARNSLLARISHDLRSPLNQIINRAQDLLPENASDGGRQIVRIAYRQLALLDDLVSFAQGELQQQELSPEAGYLYAFIRELEEEGHLLAEKHNNHFHLKIRGFLPVLVQADFRQLRRVIINLLDNAAKYTRHGHINLELISTQLHEQQVQLQFSVTDTGSGIPYELRQNLIKPFERGNHNEAGFGLGLAIVAELLEQMNSHLEVSQPESGGSSFGFTLILTQAHEFEVSHVFIDERADGIQGNDYTILLVDDVELTRCYLGELLGGYGFNTLLLERGQEAFDYLQQTHVDLIITDQLMPDMNGWELLEKLRQDFAHIPVLLYSAAPPQADQKHQHLQFDAALLKPAGSSEFLEMVFRLCQKSP